jgi:hypothetical protein
LTSVISTSWLYGRVNCRYNISMLLLFVLLVRFVKSKPRFDPKDKINRTSKGYKISNNLLGIIRAYIGNPNPDRFWGPPSLLYNEYRVSFSGVKRQRRGVDHAPLPSVEVLREIRAILLISLWTFAACSRLNFTFISYKQFKFDNFMPVINSVEYRHRYKSNY